MVRRRFALFTREFRSRVGRRQAKLAGPAENRLEHPALVATGVTVDKKPSTVAETETRARLAIIVAGTLRRPAAPGHVPGRGPARRTVVVANLR